MRWDEVKLGEIADLQLGKMLDEKKNRGQPLPYLANVNVRWGEFKLDELRLMRFESSDIERFSLKSGDIVMCEGGEPGRCAIWKAQLPSMMYQKALHRIRPKAGIDATFLYYAFRDKGMKNGFSPLFTGSTIKHLPKQQLAKVEISLPDYKSQLAISKTLSCYDDLIQNNKRRIVLLEESARQLYKEWFVRFRFPGHEHVKIVDGVPEGWKLITLGDVAVTNARSHKAKELPEELNYIDIASVTEGNIENKTTMLAADAPGRARRIAQHGDVVWSNVRPNLKAYSLVLHPNNNDVFSTGFTVITAEKVPFIYLYQFITTSAFVSYLVNHATGVGYPAVRPPDFERAPLLLPTTSLTEQFHEACVANYEQIFKLGEQNKQLAKARDLLLPKLMSGELAV